MNTDLAKEKIFGIYGHPDRDGCLMINDIDIAKKILIKDFDHFVDRTSPETNKKFFAGGDLDDLWAKQLTNLGGEDWKEVRAAFTPIFTSGKMKSMLKFIMQVSEDLTNEFDKKAKAGEEFELKDVFGKFSLDALASSAFGVNGESFTNDKSVFVKHAKRVFQTKFMDVMHIIARMIPGSQYVYGALKINTTAPEATKFFKDVITQSIRMRKESKERKNDLIDLMLDVMKEDNKEEDKDECEDQYEKDMKLFKDQSRRHRRPFQASSICWSPLQQYVQELHTSRKAQGREAGWARTRPPQTRTEKPQGGCLPLLHQSSFPSSRGSWSSCTQPWRYERRQQDSIQA